MYRRTESKKVSGFFIKRKPKGISPLGFTELNIVIATA